MFLLPEHSITTLDVIHCGDALAVLRALPSDYVDLIWIDPPYGNNNGVDDLAGARARDKVTGGRQRGEIISIANDRYEDWQSLMPQVFHQINRVLKPSGGCCCCLAGGGPNVLFGQVAIWMDTFMSFFHAIVWDKSKRGWGLGWRYRRNYEFVYVGHKKGGSLRWAENRPAQPNIIKFKPTDNKWHVTEKPVKMVEWFIENHTERNDLVLDCFIGSGTTAVAARNLGRHYIGCDISREYVELARKRLSQPYTLPMFAEVAKESA